MLKKCFAMLLVSLPLMGIARDFTYGENLVVASLERTMKVKSYMESNIDLKKLPLNEYLSYQLMKDACTPVSNELEKIRRAEDAYEDQAAKLSKLNVPCTEGGLGLSHLYVLYH